MSVTITRDNVNKVLKQIEYLTRRRVLIGIPQTADARSDGELGNAARGFIHEFGSPAQNIPPRPHLVPGVQAIQNQAADYLQTAGRIALSGGKPNDVDQPLHAVGTIAVSSVQNKIAAVIPPPLSPKTLAKRRAKGHMGQTPLIETGEYRQHITYVIRDKGE